jgi:hypothetical protein
MFPFKDIEIVKAVMVKAVKMLKNVLNVKEEESSKN